MENLYQYIEKTKTDNKLLKDNYYLLTKNEFNLFQNDEKLFKYFYGENNFVNLKKIFNDEEEIDNFLKKPEVRYGKIKYLTHITEEKIKREKNKEKIILLENKLEILRKKQKKISKKRVYLLSEEEKKSKIDNMVEKAENMVGNTLKHLFKKNEKDDGKLIKIARYIAKAIAVGLGIFVAAKTAMAAPIILIIPTTIMIVYLLYKLLTYGTKKAISLFQSALKFKGIQKFLPSEMAEKMENYADGNVEKFKTDMQKAIKNMEEKGKQQLIDFAQSSFMKISEANPKLILTIKIAMLSFKTWRIFLSPISFLLQFFSNMLLRSCGTTADTILKVLNKNKEKDNVLKATVDSLLGADIVPEDLLKVEKNKSESDKETEVTKENVSYRDLINELDSVYYEHVKENVIKHSAFLRKNNLYQENIIDQTNDDLFRKFYKKDKMEIVNGVIEKNNVKYNIFPISGKIKLKINKNQITDIKVVQQKLEENGLKNLTSLVAQDGSIVIDKNENFAKFKEAIVSNKTVTPPTEENKEELNKDEKQEEKKDEQQTTTENILDTTDLAYLIIKNDSTADNLNISKTIPNVNDDILGYLELKKKEKKENNYRFTANLFVKNIFDYRKNKLTSLFFEEEASTSNEFKNVTKTEATISLRFENNKYIINSGKFLGLFGEKSQKGEVVSSFFTYFNSGIEEIKKQYFNKYKLEVDKLKPDEKEKLTNQIDKELYDIMNISFKNGTSAVSIDSIKEIKSRTLDKISFKDLKGVGTEEKPEEEEELTDKDKFLKDNKIIYLKINDNEKIDISKLDLLKDQPTDGDGFVKLTKKDNSNIFSAEIFLKKVVNYKKNDLLKTIFESETEINNEYVNLTEKPADLEIKIENDSFQIAKKGGFLGFNKKIEKIGSLNDKYKEYANSISAKIEKDFFKQNRELSQQETETVKSKISNITNIDFKQSAEEIKKKKIEELKKEIGENSAENAEKESDEKNLPFINSRNAIALGLFTVISSAAIAWHAGVSTNPLGMAITGAAEAGGQFVKEKLMAIFGAPVRQITELNDLTKNKVDGLFKKVYQMAKVNPEDVSNGSSMNNDPSDNDFAKETGGKGGSGSGDEFSEDNRDDIPEENEEATKATFNFNRNEIIIPKKMPISPLAPKEEIFSNVKDQKEFIANSGLSKEAIKTKLETLVSSTISKEESFEKMKSVWVNSHPDSGIKIEDITPEKNPQLYQSLNKFNGEVMKSLNNYNDPYYQKSKTLLNVLKSEKEDQIKKVMKEKYENALNNKDSWLHKQIAGIKENQASKIKIEDVKDTPKTTDITDKPIPKDKPTADDKPIPKDKPAPDDSTKKGDPSENPVSKDKPDLDSFSVDEIIAQTEDFPPDEKELLKKLGEDIQSYIMRLKKPGTGPGTWVGNKHQETIDADIEKIKKILEGHGILTKYLKEKHILQIVSPASYMPDSYQYANKDEDFLFNEYFKFENKLKKLKK